MSMRETEVGCFIRYFDKKIRELNLGNVDGTGFSINISPAYPFTRPNGVPESSGYQIPGNEISKIKPPEITIHTLKRIIPNNRYQNNFLYDVYGDEGSEDEGVLLGKVYSQEVELKLQLTIWAEDPRQREFIKMIIEKSFINSRYMRKVLFEIGLRHGWQNGFVVQNIYLNNNGDIDIAQDNSSIMRDTISTDNDLWPRLYISTYEIDFTTEIRDTEWIYSNTIFDIKELVSFGINPLEYNISSIDGMINFIIDLMDCYGININRLNDREEVKTAAEIIRESSAAYGNVKNIYVDSYSFMESLEAVSIGSIGKFFATVTNNDTNSDVIDIDSDNDS